jgi:hypothetical protein
VLLFGWIATQQHNLFWVTNLSDCDFDPHGNDRD